MKRSEVYKKIDIERDYQDLRWDYDYRPDGVPDGEKPVSEWLNYIEYHLNKAKEENYLLNKTNSLSEIRKIVALGIRALEIHGCPDRVMPEKIK